MITRNFKKKDNAHKRMEKALEQPLDSSLPFQNLAIIIGAMKAGTTTLYHHLRKHPQIAGNDRAKEPSFFCRPRNKRKRDNYENGFAWYAAQWDFDPKQHLYALEASTNYTKHPGFQDSFERMAASPFTCKLIYILRDPIDRVESHLKHNFAKGRRSPDAHRSINEGHIAPSRYAHQLDEATRHFDRNDILLLSFGELCTDPPKAMAQVTSFLELCPHDFGTVEARNTRPTLPDGRKWQLLHSEKAELAEILRPDAERLQTQYGFEADHHFRTLYSIS